MENITAFCKAIKELGVPDSDNFNTIDLYESKDLFQVMIAIESLGRVAQQLNLNVPKLGVKIAEKGQVKSHEVGKHTVVLGYLDQKIHETNLPSEVKIGRTLRYENVNENGTKKK